MPRTTITAHAGCCDTPMDSLESIAAGIAGGADICELDVSALPDGTPVLQHNQPMPEDPGLVTLAAALALAQGNAVGFNLDIKDFKAVPEALRLIAAAGLGARAFFTGIGADRAQALRDSRCPLRYYLNHDIRPFANKRRLQALAKEALSLGCVGINTHYRHLSKDVVAALHAAGLLVSAWTVEDAEDMRRLIAMGVDNITTRSPQALAAVLAQSALQ